MSTVRLGIVGCGSIFPLNANGYATVRERHPEVAALEETPDAQPPQAPAGHLAPPGPHRSSECGQPRGVLLRALRRPLRGAGAPERERRAHH